MNQAYVFQIPKLYVAIIDSTKRYKYYEGLG